MQATKSSRQKTKSVSRDLSQVSSLHTKDRNNGCASQKGASACLRKKVKKLRLFSSKKSRTKRSPRFDSIDAMMSDSKENRSPVKVSTKFSRKRKRIESESDDVSCIALSADKAAVSGSPPAKRHAMASTTPRLIAASSSSTNSPQLPMPKARSRSLSVSMPISTSELVSGFAQVKVAKAATPVCLAPIKAATAAKSDTGTAAVRSHSRLSTASSSSAVNDSGGDVLWTCGRNISSESSRDAAAEVMHKAMCDLLADVMAVDGAYLFAETSSQNATDDKSIGLNAIKEKLDGRVYKDLKKDLVRDLMLLCRNALLSHKGSKTSEAYQLASTLKKLIKKREMEICLQMPKLKAKRKKGKKKKGRPRKKRGTDSHSSSSLLSSASSSAADSGKPIPRATRKRTQVADANAQMFLKAAENNGYELIEDYQFVCDETALRQTMSTGKRQCCDGQHCNDLSKLGPYSVMQETWDSECADRRLRIECTDECKCDAHSCKNRAISTRQQMVLGKDISEQQVFGVDRYTFQNIEKLFPAAYNDLLGDGNAAKSWIESKLMPAMNAFQRTVSESLPQFESRRPSTRDPLSRGPFYLTDVLRMMLFIAEQTPDDFLQIKLITFMLRVILTMALDYENNDGDYSFQLAKARVSFDGEDSSLWNSETFLQQYVCKPQLEATGEGLVCDSEFPVYSKGTGVVCVCDEGIAANQFVVPFLGEVYPPWLWYEKSDRIKYLEKRRGAEKQSDFFNMMLERHMDDSDGFDLLFVDPSKRGNFASRISHSCAPNCIAISMAVSGSLKIAVFATRQIVTGEELSFDYHSVTEDETEWKQAICLCGTQKCRNYYLAYVGSGSYTQVLHQRHHFLNRTAMIYKCCESESVPMEAKFVELMERNNIKGSPIDWMPLWLKKFCAFVLEYAEFEQKLLPSELRKLGVDSTVREEDLTEEAHGLKHQRIQNLMISLNKMKYFFAQKVNRPFIGKGPVVHLSDADVLDRLWVAKDALVPCFQDAAKKHLEAAGHLAAIEKVKQLSRKVCIRKTRKACDECLLELAALLRTLPSTEGAYHHAAADVCEFYANTAFFFTSFNNYGGFKSPAFSFKELGYTSEGSADAKKYGAQYPWGQLNFWERQTIESPDSSLSAQRRGTISLPNIACCYSHSLEIGLKRAYGPMQRDELLLNIESKPHNAWSTKLHWSFRNGKFYGSPWLDAFIDETHRGKFETLVTGLKSATVLFPGGERQSAAAPVDDVCAVSVASNTSFDTN